MSKFRGFTLLEFLVTLAIIAVVTTVTLPAYNSWTEGKSFDNLFNDLTYELRELSNMAQIQNTTTKIIISEAGGIYTLSTFISSAPTTTCTSAGTWTADKSVIMDIPSTYQITGNGMDSTCFYRDGSSSGGNFIISPIDGSSSGDTATITVTIATGYLDVVVD